MSGFFASMFAEMGARRKRLREAFGDRGQALSEFLLLAGLGIGSLGLLVRPWMADAAPWGFALPFVFVFGFLLIELRRQAALKIEGAIEKTSTNFDWATFLWALTCALAGAAAFAVAWGAKPPEPDQSPAWEPPGTVIDSTIELPAP